MKTYICENCKKEHDGSYGSGRFCSKRCRGQFSAKGKNTGKRRNEPWKCDQCECEFHSRSMLYQHKREVHQIKPVWNKGLTKETDKRIAQMSEHYVQGIKSGRITVWCKGKHLSNEIRTKISSSMQLAHKEGRAHNIGESRWNNEPSYPEKWFIQVIENEFEDKQYIREYSFHQFSLDFAWPQKRKCIEIDGDQHQRFEEYKERDKRKDTLLKAEGWKVLRLIWKDVYAEPKKWIQIAKDFLL